MPAARKLALCLTVALLSACANIPLETDPSAMYKEGETLYGDKRYDDAIAQYKKVRDAYASTELSSSAELRIADAYFDSERFIEASSAYDEFRKLHPTHPKTPYAIYRMGLSNFNLITGTDRDQTPQKNTVVYFEEFLLKYPKSEYAADAVTKLEDVKAQQLKYEQYVAGFYIRTDKYVSAIKRLEEALVAFPKHPGHDETWYLLGVANVKTGDMDKARTAFNRLSTDFPDSKFITDASKLLEKHY
jgi:outer membrane protein assembly factor BamD